MTGDSSSEVCLSCGVRFPPGSTECPNCGRPTGDSDRRGRSRGQNQQGSPPGQNQQGPPPGQNQQEPPPQRGGQQQSGGGLTSNMGMLALIVVGAVLFAIVATVILSSVIASFVLGLDSDTSGPHPVASFEYDYDATANELTVTHEGGDELPADEVLLVGDIEEDGQTWADQTDAADVTPGDSITVTPTDERFEIEIVWDSRDTDDRVTIDTYEQ